MSRSSSTVGSLLSSIGLIASQPTPHNYHCAELYWEMLDGYFFLRRQKALIDYDQATEDDPIYMKRCRSFETIKHSITNNNPSQAQLIALLKKEAWDNTSWPGWAHIGSKKYANHLEEIASALSANAFTVNELRSALQLTSRQRSLNIAAALLRQT